MENLVTINELSSVFNGRRVFVTGHTGFKGAWLAACLHRAGAIVKGYALPPAYPNGLFALLQPMGILEHVVGDIRDQALLTKELLAFKPDFIFHLAAQPLVRKSYEIPAETFSVNVAGTANLLEGAGKLPGKCTIVVVTTDKVYENKEQDILYKEDDALGGYDPYSASKACTELVVASFRNSFFNPAQIARHKKAIAAARAGNVIGGGDWSTDRIIPDIVRALQDDQTVSVRNPSAVRPWQHVLEPVVGYLLLAAGLDREPGRFSTAFNFGPLPGDHLTVRELVETAITSLGQGAWEDKSDPNQPHEAGLLKLDITKAKETLGWMPKLNARAAIQWTMDWYHQPRAGQQQFTFRQIDDYFSL